MKEKLREWHLDSKVQTSTRQNYRNHKSDVPPQEINYLQRNETQTGTRLLISSVRH